MDSNVPMIRDDALTPMTLEGLMTQATMLVASGILPKDIRTPEAAAAIILTGRELGIPPMQSFRAIYIVNGKPTISTEHMAAMLLQAGMTYNIDRLDAGECAITFKRPGMEYTHTFTAADAQKAGLWKGNTWSKYPKDMLYNRCFSGGARKFAPDVLGKMYTPEEIDPDGVTIDVDGQIVVVSKPEPELLEPEAIYQEMKGQTDQQKRNDARPATRPPRGPALPPPAEEPAAEPTNGEARWDAFCLKLATETDMTVGTVKQVLGARNQYKRPANARQAFADWMNSQIDSEASAAPRPSPLDQARAEAARIEEREASIRDGEHDDAQLAAEALYGQDMPK